MRYDVTELFELVEEAFDEIALAIERLLPAEPSLAPDHVGNVGDGAAGLEMLPEPIGVVGLVGDQDGASLEVGQEGVGGGQIVGLTRSDQELDRPPLAVDAGVDFGREPAATAAHATISTVFLTPEAC